MADLLSISRALSAAVDSLSFSEPVTHVYNPLNYAWSLYEQYIQRFGRGRKSIVMLGMNPGPWGMAQTGIPFGEIPAVRDWMGLDAAVDKPAKEHPKRPVTGLACERSEVSGRRLWGAFAERYPDPATFFAKHFVLNYCPLSFMADTGRNITPDKLPAKEREPLFAICDTHTRQLIETMAPDWVIGVGGFAKKRAELICEGLDLQIGTILHPSPASPAANRGWAAAATKQMSAMGIWD